MIRFSLFGIPIEVQPWFWVALIFVSGRYDANTPEKVAMLALFLLAGFISILVHELGHALTAKHFGARVAITLEAFGGYAAYSGVYLSRAKSFLVTLAGPVVQIILGVLAFIALMVLPSPNEFGIDFLQSLGFISIIWAVLNLLPIFPLDGGHLLHSLLGPRRIRITLIVSIVTAVILAGLGIVLFKAFLLSLFMVSFAYQAYSMLKQHPR